MNKTLFAVALAGTAMLFAIPHSTAVAVDSRGANPHRLGYTDIKVDRPEFDEPFRRDGRLVPPASVLQVLPGRSADEVRGLIGEPVGTGQGARGPEWDYNLKLDLADEDFIVCQYKVVFDADSEKVVEAWWRRYQCRDAMAAYEAATGV